VEGFALFKTHQKYIKICKLLQDHAALPKKQQIFFIFVPFCQSEYADEVAGSGEETQKQNLKKDGSEGGNQRHQAFV